MFDFVAGNSPKSMKEQNEPKLYAFTAFQFSLFSIIFVLSDLASFSVPDVTTAIFSVIALGGVAISSTVLTDMMPTSWKTDLTLCFKGSATEKSRHIATQYLSGAEARSILEIYELPMHSDVKDKHIFGKLREFTAGSAGAYQAYKKYLLVREYSIIQILLTVLLPSISFIFYPGSGYNVPYSVYMVLTTILLLFTTISTDRRFVEIVLKQSSLVSASLRRAIEAREVTPRESGDRK